MSQPPEDDMNLFWFSEAGHGFLTKIAGRFFLNSVLIDKRADVKEMDIHKPSDRLLRSLNKWSIGAGCSFKYLRDRFHQSLI